MKNTTERWKYKLMLEKNEENMYDSFFIWQLTTLIIRHYIENFIPALRSVHIFFLQKQNLIKKVNKICNLCFELKKE